MKKLLLILAILLTIGCASAPVQDEAVNATSQTEEESLIDGDIAFGSLLFFALDSLF